MRFVRGVSFPSRLTLFRHHGVEWVFGERQRRCSETPDRLMYKDWRASGRHLRPRSAGLLIPASQVRILPGTPPKFETPQAIAGFLFIRQSPQFSRRHHENKTRSGTDPAT